MCAKFNNIEEDPTSAQGIITNNNNNKTAWNDGQVIERDVGLYDAHNEHIIASHKHEPKTLVVMYDENKKHYGTETEEFDMVVPAPKIHTKTTIPEFAVPDASYNASIYTIESKDVAYDVEVHKDSDTNTKELDLVVAPQKDKVYKGIQGSVVPVSEEIYVDDDVDTLTKEHDLVVVPQRENVYSTVPETVVPVSAESDVDDEADTVTQELDLVVVPQKDKVYSIVPKAVVPVSAESDVDDDDDTLTRELDLVVVPQKDNVYSTVPKAVVPVSAQRYVGNVHTNTKELDLVVVPQKDKVYSTVPKAVLPVSAQRYVGNVDTNTKELDLVVVPQKDNVYSTVPETVVPDKGLHYEFQTIDSEIIYDDRVEATDAEEVLLASGVYNDDYQKRMADTVNYHPSAARTHPVIGFGLKQLPPCVYVSYVFQGGPAHQVGIERDDEIIAIGPSPVSNFEEVRAAINEHCVVGKVTTFVVRKAEHNRIVKPKLWIMTNSPDCADKPYYFNMATAPKVMHNGPRHRCHRRSQSRCSKSSYQDGYHPSMSQTRSLSRSERLY